MLDAALVACRDTRIRNRRKQVLEEEAREQQFLNKLNKMLLNPYRKKFPDNLYISRKNERPWGQAKTILYIDGIGLGEYDLDKDNFFSLKEGKHHIWFRLRGIRSRVIEINSSEYEAYGIMYDPCLFHIATQVYTA